MKPTCNAPDVQRNFFHFTVHFLNFPGLVSPTGIVNQSGLRNRVSWKKCVVTHFFFAFILSTSGLLAQSNFIGSASDELIAEITLMDSLLFSAAFNDCDPDQLEKLITDDFEFYHDKGGQIANSKEDFITGVRTGCERQATGQDNKAKRELIKESTQVYPLNNYGALQIGEHRFYQMKNGEYVYTENAKFTHLWKQAEGGWKLARVLSYDHKQ